MPQPAQHSSTARYIGDISIARDYDRQFAHSRLFQYDTSLVQQWFSEPGRLIDLGCGTGRHLLTFAQRGFDVVGVDLSQHMLSQARRKLLRAQFQPFLLNADICNLPITTAELGGPLAPDSFDYALCMFSTIGLIHGHANRLHFLQDVLRLLKPLGKLALHVHNASRNVWSLEGWQFLIANFFQSRLGRAEPGDKILTNYRGINRMYIHVFTESEIVDLLQDAGFDPPQVHPLNRHRTGPLAGRFLRSIRANGFLIRAQKPR